MTDRWVLDSAKLRLAMLIAFLALGFAVTRQYGESWDERQFFKYADRALESYSSWPRTGTIPLTGNTYDNYGPAYVMIVALGARLLGAFLPWITSDLRHVIYFATFAAGMWAFDALCRRWMSSGAALGASLLFATQPVIWGHAFVSPKDVPFLTFFLLSLVLGFRMADSLQDASIERSARHASTSLMLFTGVWAAVIVGLAAATPLVHSTLIELVSAAAAGQSNILLWIASDIRTVQPGVYVEKYFVLFIQARAVLTIVSAVLLAFVWRRIPQASRRFLSIAPAGLVLGLTTSIRALGPLAGLMVAVYAIRKSGRSALAALLIYGGVATVAAYLTWPYLWPDPLGHFVESVRVMAQYPWRGEVLFNGATYLSTELPRTYLPVLLGIQLTEPVWPLFAAGTWIAIYASLNKKASGREVLALAALWFILPLIGLVATRAPLYDNFRQVIFILPPVFMMAGIALEKVRRPVVLAALIALVVMPGLVDGARLHPYEYAYYNRFVGGVHGAFRKYELDYWGTSYREAAVYLNGSASANANIWVEGPAHLLQTYARPDLKIFSTYEVERAEHYDYVVALTRFNLDLRSYPGARIDHVIERQGAFLTVIKRP